MSGRDFIANQSISHAFWSFPVSSHVISVICSLRILQCLWVWASIYVGRSSGRSGGDRGWFKFCFSGQNETHNRVATGGPRNSIYGSLPGTNSISAHLCRSWLPRMILVHHWQPHDMTTVAVLGFMSQVVGAHRRHLHPGANILAGRLGSNLCCVKSRKKASQEPKLRVK